MKFIVLIVVFLLQVSYADICKIHVMVKPERLKQFEHVYHLDMNNTETEFGDNKGMKVDYYCVDENIETTNLIYYENEKYSFFMDHVCFKLSRKNEFDRIIVSNNFSLPKMGIAMVVCE